MMIIFDDFDEKTYFWMFMAKRLNQKLADVSEELAVQPTIFIESEWLEDIVAEYGK